MISILALILRNHWVSEGSDRKGHRGEEEVGTALWKKPAGAKVLRQSTLPQIDVGAPEELPSGRGTWSKLLNISELQRDWEAGFGMFAR